MMKKQQKRIRYLFTFDITFQNELNLQNRQDVQYLKFVVFDYKFGQFSELMESIFVQHLSTANGTVINRNYQVLGMLGEGTFGKVWKVQRQEDKKIFGLKVIPKALIAQEPRKSRILREIDIQQRVKHPFICQLYTVFQDQKNIHLLLQYVFGKNLEQLIRQKGKFTLLTTKKILQQILEAVGYLHSQHIFHRDIKPGNIMLDEDGNVKIIDFGFAAKIQHVGAKRFSICGSPQFMAPQIISYALKMPNSYPGYSYQIDIWAIGVLIYFMLTGTLPFDGPTQNKIFSEAIAARPKKTLQFSDEAWNLLLKIFKVNPQKRITLEKMKNHIFLSNSTAKTPCSLSRLFDIRFGRKDNQIKQLKQTKQQKQPKQNRSTFQNAYLSSYGLKSFKKIFSSDKKQSRSIKSMNKCFQPNNGSISKNKLNKTVTNSYSCESVSNCQKNSDKQRTSISSLEDDILFVIKIQKTDICVYIFNNGVKGTYERGQNIQILFNPSSKTYSKIQHGKIYSINLIQLEQDYKKHLQILNKDQQQKNIFTFNSIKSIELQIRVQKLVYIDKFYDIKMQQCYFLRLSNKVYELLDYQGLYAMIQNPEKDETTYVQLKDEQIQNKTIVTQHLLNTDKRIKRMHISIHQAINKTIKIPLKSQ